VALLGEADNEDLAHVVTQPDPEAPHISAKSAMLTLSLTNGSRGGT
jgi:hypothetical protein